MKNKRAKPSKISLLLKMTILSSVCAIIIGVIAVVDQMGFTINAPYILHIERGTGTLSIAQNLKDAGIIKNCNIFRILLSYNMHGNQILAGEYLLQHGDEMENLIGKLKNHEFYYRQIIFVPGHTVSEYIEQINNSYGLLGGVSIIPDDGTLMPETYSYTFGETKDSLIHRMQDANSEYIKHKWSGITQDFYLHSKEDVVILASIVEKEAGNADEAQMIAAVFKNRLAKGMHLQADPTVIYNITLGKYTFDRPITKADLHQSGPYNTYLIKGLPKGAISNPSKASIDAVFAPAQTNAIYFMANGAGKHNFTNDYAVHRQNIQNYKDLKHE